MVFRKNKQKFIYVVTFWKVLTKCHVCNFSALDLDDKDINEEEPILSDEYRRVWNITEEKINETHYQELSGG